jgi:hypothetical protein
MELNYNGLALLIPGSRIVSPAILADFIPSGIQFAIRKCLTR